VSSGELDGPNLKSQLLRAVRSRSASHIVDLSLTDPDECAIYTLSDPRDLRAVRYVGQTRSPGRRYMQHLTAARLWLPNTLPWWIKRPELRPLYLWIRELHLDGARLPAMAVIAWSQAAQALAEERRHICEHLRNQLPLLNREAATFQNQLPLL
jgi:hypothetical protein